MSITEVAKRTSAAKFTSPQGFLSHPHLDQPDRTHDANGVFSAGIHLTVAELAAVEAELRAIFSAAYPDETREPRLPLWRHPDGPITLFAKSRQRPRIVSEAFRPILGVNAGARVRLLCNAKPYRFGERVGVSLFLNIVQVVALDARDPRRERKRQETEALRQVVAMARSRTGAR
ncbi:hypothetical protein [Methylobacterium sp. ARG-1]|uniref:hypothetical protein n=1 Tax=Methylobacterium sp. ARG-1 TaxID=1692501 RepID=UPI00068363D4|nr:hypothetical protein [Methylobacterium sp. ARG-1]KNY21067.1 hypothetical protein AKJ13_18885 [Methylobacterium sp. ARG-1]